MEQTPEYFYTPYLSDVLNEKKLLQCSSLWENQVQILFSKLLSKEGLTCVFMWWYGSNSASFSLTVHQAAKHFNLKSKTLHSLMWGDVSFVATVGTQVVWRESWKSGGLLLSGVSRPLPWSLWTPIFLAVITTIYTSLNLPTHLLSTSSWAAEHFITLVDLHGGPIK